jgi:hypothetical protein
MTTTARDSTIRNIAASNLGLATLETKDSDAADFHDLAVWNIKTALEAAYEAGRAQGNRDAWIEALGGDLRGRSKRARTHRLDFVNNRGE